MLAAYQQTVNNVNTDITIIIPTYNEAENIPELLRRIKNTLEKELPEASYEILIIDDDSPDNTAGIASSIAEELGIRENLQVIIRKEERGLSTAVVKGLENARGKVILVMDADLQHPPEKIPELVRPLLYEDYEISIATRYKGGRDEGLSFTRKLMSKAATIVAKLLLPQVRKISDPMTGFFAIKDTVVKKNLHNFNPKGYKILLEILVKGDYSPEKIIEIAYTFNRRYRGYSKLGPKETIDYLFHILQLNDYRILKFMLVGLTGLFVNEGILWLLHYKLFFPLWFSGLLSIETSILSNFTLNSLVTFRNVNTKTKLYTKIYRYHIATAVGVSINYSILLSLTYLLHIEPLVSNLIGIIAGFLANYTLSEHYVWQRAPKKEMNNNEKH